MTSKETKKSRTSNFLQQWSESHRLEWLSHIRPEIRELVARGEPLTFDQFSMLRLNGYERCEVHPLLTDKALIKLVEEVYLPNCTPYHRRPPEHYDAAVISELTPILIDRCKAAIAERNQPSISGEFSLFDNEKNREKEKVLSEWEIAADDSDNPKMLDDEQVSAFLQWGKSYRITITELPERTSDAQESGQEEYQASGDPLQQHEG